jgi:hypothetical protein
MKAGESAAEPDIIIDGETNTVRRIPEHASGREPRDRDDVNEFDEFNDWTEMERLMRAS